MDAQTIPSVDDLLTQIQEIEPLIRAESAACEQQRHLSSSVADALRSLGCYRLYRPRSRGGFGLDPVSGFRIVEELSRIDSAAGWNVAVANGCEVFGAWFRDEVTEEIFGPADTTMAGGLFPPRKAVPTDGGYLVSGRTLFNSNCHAANWVLCEAMIYDNGEPRLDDDGVEQGLFMFFPMSDAVIVENWDTMGMRGTGSHDIEVNDLFVPEYHTAPLLPLESTYPAYGGPLHRLGIWPALAINGVTALGVAQAAIDGFIDLAGNKTPAYTSNTLRDRSIVQLRVGEAQAHVRAGRAFLHETFDNVWQSAVDGNYLDIHQKADCQQAASHMVMESARAVNLIHSVASSAAIRNDKSFQRHFRDIHVITQHAFFCESRLEAVGQIRLGLDSDWDFLYF